MESRPGSCYVYLFNHPVSREHRTAGKCRPISLRILDAHFPSRKLHAVMGIFLFIYNTCTYSAVQSSGEWDEYLKPRGGGNIWKYKTCPVQLRALPPPRAVTCSWPVLCTALPPLFFFSFNFHYYLYFCTQLNWEVEGWESGTRQTDIMGLNPAQLFSQQPSPLQSQGNKCSSRGS